MSAEIGTIIEKLKDCFDLYPKKTFLKRVAYTGEYSDLHNRPTTTILDSAVLRFQDEKLKEYDNGGQIMFFYKASSVATSTITENNKQLDVVTDAFNVSGQITSHGLLNTGTLTTDNIIVNTSTTLNGTTTLDTLKVTNSATFNKSITTSGITNSANTTITTPLLTVSTSASIQKITNNVATTGITNTGAISTTTLSTTSTASIGSTLTTNGIANTGSISTTTLSVTSTASIASTLTSNGITNTGDISTTGYFKGTATSAQWADLAENYSSDNKYPMGTLVQFGGDKEITVARTEANGVISEKPAYLMNSNEDGLPVALCGRVKVLVKGHVKKFDKISLSDIGGVGVVSDAQVIARALEDKDDDGVGLVLCITQFRL